MLFYEQAYDNILSMNLKDFLTISEFSEWTGIARSALQYYDNEGLFQPAHRGENNYRYYTYLQTILINLITTLKSIGVPLETIGDLMRNRTPEDLLSLLSNKEQEIALEIERLRDAKKVITVFSNHIRDGIYADSDKIYVTYSEAEPITLGLQNDYSDDDTFYNAFQRYCQGFKEKGGNLHYPIGGWWESMDDFIKNPVRPSRFYSVDPYGEEQKKAGRYLIGYNRGYYGQIGNLPERMKEFARENELEFGGPMYNLFLLDEISVLNHEQYLMRASVLLK